jgi:hypothetical protein
VNVVGEAWFGWFLVIGAVCLFNIFCTTAGSEKRSAPGRMKIVLILCVG